MATKFNLLLDLSNNTSLKSFLIALDDKANFKNLSKEKAKLPPIAGEILNMLNDQHFKKTSSVLVKNFRQVKQGKYSVIKLKSEGREFHDYLTQKYPIGYKRLQDCGNEIVGREVKVFDTDIASDVAAAVEAVVFSAVWANVAAVTNVAIALEAVVSIGVFVV